ncbi:hypothetical protein GW755_02910 [bacterium]|nr:hypothetical protein [Candidatus Parcubacteria bacterium]NCT55776.1 hypothetical protein [bacterium]
MAKRPKLFADVLKNKSDGSKYVNHEFQIYGHWLATQLGADDKQIGMFIKLAKNQDRAKIQTALEFVKGAYKPKSKVSLFLWKMKKLREEREEKSVANKGLPS